VPRAIQTLFIPGPAGRLEALLEEPEHGAPREAVLVCHPHPKHGGTMHNKVVYRIARGFRKSGAVVLRFNYRGVNLSEGVYDRGIGEVDDARACLAWLRERYPDLPYTLAGFSFGSRVVLRLACRYPGARRVIAVGFPTRYEGFEFLESCDIAKVFLHSTHDEHGPKPELERLFAGFAEPKRLIFIESADHFFRDALDEFERRVQEVAAADS
jgi:alpha/beta superfamily hydrolase